jgi:uncharacterized membrane protein
LIVAIVLALGPVIRHFFNSRHSGQGSPWWVWGVVAAGMVAIAFLSAAGPREARSGEVAGATFAHVERIIRTRCSMCHAAEPVWPSLAMAPKSIRFDEADQIRRYARLIGRNAAWSTAMPPGNITEMTSSERATLAAWLAAGAPAQ